MKKFILLSLISLLSLSGVSSKEKLTKEQKIEKKTLKIASLKEKQSSIQAKIDQFNEVATEQLTSEKKTELENLTSKLEILNAKELKVSSKLKELQTK